MLSVRVDDDREWIEDGDEEINQDIDADEMAIEELCTGSSCSAPSTGLLQIRVISFIRVFGNSWQILFLSFVSNSC